MLLEVPTDLKLPRGTEHLLDSLTLQLSPDDGMWEGNPRHYLSCGASALSVVLAALRLADIPDPDSLLDFGAGAGRVTRWLRAAFPDASIDACDLREQDLAFCSRYLNAHTWISGIDIDSLKAPRTFDLIWLGSVLTHLSAANTLKVLDKMLTWINKGGLIVMSFHGRYALHRQNTGEFNYLHEPAWSTVASDYQNVGYGYADYKGQSGYGVSVIKLSWFAKVLEEHAGAKLILLAEKAWDGHHDVLAVQKV